MKRRSPTTLLAALALLPLAGCLREASPMSPTPDQDPARHARSVREMEGVARRNQEAEARFFRKVRAQSPEPEPAHAGSTTGPDATVTTIAQESP
jgi:hypothetical protein